MACYESLILTATALGETKLATACKGILKDEEEAVLAKKAGR